uniref:exostosin domain-containing protein n=1 Tax=Synechococcus sp. CS-1329 TaxID=2847975 RepID=UPI00223BBBFD|nr:exostosin family protein [Synechococcus sp. CS-1329]
MAFLAVMRSASQRPAVFDPNLQQLIAQAERERRQGQWPHALHLYRRALALAPQHPGLRTALSLLRRLHPLPGCLHQPEAQPRTLPSPADAAQLRELQAADRLGDLSFDWYSLSGQFQHALNNITRSSRIPLIVDAGTTRASSALWLARRWSQAEVVVLVQRPLDREAIAAAVAGTNVRFVEAQGSEITGPILPSLALLDQLLPATTHTPALLHLDADLVDMAALFSGEAFWLPQFPVVLIRGGLAADPQGRTLPQPYHHAFAAFGYETLRSGSVLVAFHRPRLVELAAADLVADPAAPAPQASEAAQLSGETVLEPGLVAFDGEWQFPAITEQRAFQLMRQRPNPVDGVLYVGFPWASLIDHLNNGTAKGRALLAELDRLLPHLQGASRRITVCQQIFFLQHRWIFERAGITDVFWPHTTIFAADPALRLHPFPLFAVQWQQPTDPEPSRDILYSFIGAHSTRLYLSNSRDLILSSLAGQPGALIQGNDGWFYEDLVYGVQITGRIGADDPRAMGTGPEEQRHRYIDSLRRSVFCLCPSGTGPNTIRLWEAIGSGAIPIILSDTFRPPGPRQLWDDAVFLLPDNAQGVMAIPQLAKQWAADPELLAAKRAGLRRLWQRYSPDTFITDIIELIDGLRG